jgi:methylglutaconyl-CoA hydratase
MVVIATVDLGGYSRPQTASAPRFQGLRGCRASNIFTFDVSAIQIPPSPEMRSQFLPSSLPRVLRRLYSSKSTPLINITDIPTPSSPGRIRILSLARPSARNAISRQLLWELRSHIDAVAAEYNTEGEEVPAQKKYGGAAGEDKRGPTRALILASEVDSCFCAGADLKERAGFTAEE